MGGVPRTAEISLAGSGLSHAISGELRKNALRAPTQSELAGAHRSRASEAVRSGDHCWRALRGFVYVRRARTCDAGQPVGKAPWFRARCPADSGVGGGPLPSISRVGRGARRDLTRASRSPEPSCRTSVSTSTLVAGGKTARLLGAPLRTVAPGGAPGSGFATRRTPARPADAPRTRGPTRRRGPR